MEQWLYLLRSKFEDLDNELQAKIYHYFYRFLYKDVNFMIRDHAQAEDIIQEVFFKVITHDYTKHHITNMKSWIKQVSRNATIDWLRKNKKHRHKIALDFIINKELCDRETANDVEIKIRNELLHQVLNEIKPEYRLLLTMHYLEGKPYKEICHKLNITESVLTQRMARARKKLLQQFLRKWTDRDE
jgi:RNA polymerase sigma factor (sigma-70 family)